MRQQEKETKNTFLEAPLMMRRVIYYIRRRVKVLILWIEAQLNIEIRSL